MPEDRSHVVRQLLEGWYAGNDEALHAVLPLVYEELRLVAHNYLRKERRDHTLQSTALVHEAYLRLEKQGKTKIENRAHFLAICAGIKNLPILLHKKSSLLVI